jgi:hypothetical protein
MVRREKLVASYLKSYFFKPLFKQFLYCLKYKLPYYEKTVGLCPFTSAFFLLPV